MSTTHPLAFDCRETVCRPDMPHGFCIVCGATTDGKGAWIDPDSLKRKIPFLCGRCVHHPDVTASQKALREKRAAHDRRLMTEPIDDSRVQTGELIEQYDSKARRAIRAVIESGAESALLFDVSPMTVDSVLKTLGMQDDFYVESRQGELFLRKSPNANTTPSPKETP